MKTGTKLTCLSNGKEGALLVSDLNGCEGKARGSIPNHQSQKHDGSPHAHPTHTPPPSITKSAHSPTVTPATPTAHKENPFSYMRVCLQYNTV